MQCSRSKKSNILCTIYGFFRFRYCLREVVTPSILTRFQNFYMFWKAMIPIRSFLILLMLFSHIIISKIPLSAVECNSWNFMNFMKFHEIVPTKTELYLENKAFRPGGFFKSFPDHREPYPCQFLAQSATPPLCVVIFVRVPSRKTAVRSHLRGSNVRDDWLVECKSCK